MSLRTARREGAWALFLGRVQNVIPREPAKPLLAALGQRFVPPGPPPLLEGVHRRWLIFLQVALRQDLSVFPSSEGRKVLLLVYLGSALVPAIRVAGIAPAEVLSEE